MKLLITALMLVRFAEMRDEDLTHVLSDVRTRHYFTEGHQVALPEEQQKIRSRVVDLTQKSIAGHMQEHPLLSMHHAAAVLMAMDDDESTISAFQKGLGSLDWDEQMDAATALSACHDDRALALIDGLAAPMVVTLGDALEHTTDEAEAQRRNDRLGLFCEVLKSMARSANPAGMALAHKHRDAFAARYTSENGRLIVSILDAEFAEAEKRRAAMREAAKEAAAAAAAKGKQGAVPEK